MKKFLPDISPCLPQKTDFGIGIIGAGSIIQYGHMPAYKKAGFNVVGIASRGSESAESKATAWNIPWHGTDWRALIDMPQVQIIDITYPFDDERLEIVKAAAMAGKHILMQKPMAHSMETAREMVNIAKEHNVLLAVNQNARWSPQYRAVYQAINAGLLGEVYLLVHEMQNNQDAADWFVNRWYGQTDRFQIMEYSVHHIDLMRFWTGMEPTRVKASIAKKPTQRSKGDMIASIQLEFPDHCLGIVVDDNAAYPHAGVFSRFKIEGTKGIITGEAMSNVDFRIQSELLGDDAQQIELKGQWFPDGFIGTMAELMCAIEEKREPSISGEDNLKTLEIIFAAYKNADF